MGNTVTESLLVGLDIGSSKITVIVAKREPDGTLSYVEGLPAPMAGMRNGVVVNMTDVTAAIRATIYEVEERCGRRITSASVSVGGPHLQSHLIRSAVSITPPGREITDDDIARAIAATSDDLNLGPNRDILHEIPRAYRVDGQGGVIDPRGMLGYQLEAEVQYTVGAATTIANLLKCVTQAGIEPTMLVAAPLAAGEAVRGTYASDGNFAVLDVGAAMSALTCYSEGFSWASDIFTIGGAELTQALAAELRLAPQIAEEVKMRYGYAGLETANEYELVDLPHSTDVETLLPRSEITRIIHERARCLADAVQPRLHEARLAGMAPEALILTGGGADLPGLDEFLRYALELPVYIGVPSGIHNLPASMERPAFATAIGLMLWSASYSGMDDHHVARRSVRAVFPQMAAGVKRIFRVMLP